MPTVIGGLMALVALAASILSGVDPVSCLMRGLIAYLVGAMATHVWYVFFAVRVVEDSDSSSDAEPAAST